MVILFDRVQLKEPKNSRLDVYESQKIKSKVQPTNKDKGKNRLSKYEMQEPKVEDNDEVNIYLKLPLLNSAHFEFEFDIVKKFWVSKQKTLPKLYKLAVTRLHVPAYCGSLGPSVIDVKEDLEPGFSQRFTYHQRTYEGT